MTEKKDKHYVQFSKKAVIWVNIAVTLVVFIGITLAYLAGDIDQMTDIIKIYVQYDMVVFVAYSGNSMLEKWLVNKGPTLNVSSSSSSADDDDTSTEDSDG